MGLLETRATMGTHDTEQR